MKSSRVEKKRAAEIARLREGVNDVAALSIDFLLGNRSEQGDQNAAVEVSRMARHYLDGHSELPANECQDCGQTKGNSE